MEARWMSGDENIDKQDPALRARARQAIRSGKLPSRDPGNVWGGPGRGECCALCNAAVGRGDLEFEIELASLDGSGPDTFRFHSGCWTAWHHEVQGSDG